MKWKHVGFSRGSWVRRATNAVPVALAVSIPACSADGTRPEGPGAADRRRYADRAVFVRDVIDGDTAIIEDGTSVRYIGIDAPEERPVRQCGSSEATAANREFIDRRSVVLRLDAAETRDRFGRLLAYLEVEGEIVNVELVRQGVACAFPFGNTRRFREEIAAAEAEARSGDRGIWGRCPPVPDGCPPVPE